jgi:hypothetical protein
VIVDDDPLTLKEAWELLMRACGTGSLDDQIEILNQLKELPMFARRERRGYDQLVNREDWWRRSPRISESALLSYKPSTLKYYKRDSDELDDKTHLVVDEDNSFFECTFRRGVIERLAKSLSEDAAETETTQRQREPVIVMLKKLYQPHGLRPKGTSVKQVMERLNKLPEFRDNPVSEDTVYRAFKDIEAALEATRKK